MSHKTRKRPAPRKKVDPREVGPIAWVVDSSGQPVTHTWTPTGKRKKPRTTQIGIYRQSTSLPADERGRHTVWSSDEDHGDTYPWGKDDPVPFYLAKFQAEARSGQLSGTFALTDYGRALSDGGAESVCKCNGGGPLRETPHAAPKKDDRGGMNSRAWAKHLRRLKLEGGSE